MVKSTWVFIFTLSCGTSAAFGWPINSHKTQTAQVSYKSSLSFGI